MKKHSPYVVLLTGGTGGHVYPAIGLAEKILERFPQAEIVCMGGGILNSPYFHACPLPRIEIPYGQFLMKRPLTVLSFLVNSFKGACKTFRHLKDKTPDLVVAFGSYHTFPSLLPIIWQKIPFHFYDSNAVPGKVVRNFSRFATKTLITYPCAKPYLKGLVEYVRPENRKSVEGSGISKKIALERYSLEPGKTTAVFIGGSQGASGLENALLECLPLIAKDVSKLQWIHISGKHGNVRQAQSVYDRWGISACVIPYEEEMAYFWKAADFAVTRAGSGILQELAQTLTPAIVVPLPGSADEHQQKNGQFFQDTIEGGVVCEQSKEKIGHWISHFLEEPSFRETCKSRMLEHNKAVNYKTFSEVVCKALESSGEKI